MILSKEEEVEFLEKQLSNICALSKSSRLSIESRLTLIESLSEAALEELEKFKEESGLAKLENEKCQSSY